MSNILGPKSTLSAVSGIRLASDEFSKEAEKLSSGKRINSAGDDASGAAMVTKLHAQIAGLRQSGRNANDALSLIQVNEGGLSEISSMIVRLKELAVQNSTDTMTDMDREYAQLEYDSLVEEIDRTLKSSSFNGVNLLDPDSSNGVLSFQVGPFDDASNTIEFDDSVGKDLISGLDLSSTDITTRDSALSSMESIEDSLNRVSAFRAHLGSVQNRLQYTINNLESSVVNFEDYRSNKEDTDYAESTSKLSTASIRMNAAQGVLGHVNFERRNLLKLIG